MKLLQSRRLALGALLGTLALWATLRDVDAAALGQALSGIHPASTVSSLAATLLSLAVVVARWKLLFSPDRTDVSYSTLFRVTVVGQMLNILVPLRVGELARLYGVSKAANVDTGRVVATLAIEKAIEVTVFGAAAMTLLLLVAMPAQIATARAAWIVVPLLATAVLWTVASYAPATARRLGTIAHVPAPIERRLVAFSDSLAAGLRSASSPGIGGRLLALSVAALLLSAFANQILLEAFDLQLPIWSGLALLIVLQVGSVPPSLPGRVGVFNYLTVVTLGWLGVDRVTAASFSIALYAVAYVPKLLLGALFMATDMSLMRPAGAGTAVAGDAS